MGINWNVLCGMAFGGSFVLLVFFVHAWFKKRRRHLNKERPPVKTKLLRPAGYSLSSTLEQLSENFNLFLLLSVLTAMLAGFIVAAVFPLAEGLILQKFTWGQLRQQPQFYLIYSILFLLLSASCWSGVFIIRAISTLNQMRNYRFGLRGEQAVAEQLANRQLISAGYVAFHDVPGDGSWNIDHVVIGPAGIFVLETKTRSRRKSAGDQDERIVVFDGRRLQFPWCFDTKAVEQVANNAKWVRKFADGFVPEGIPIQPVIVVPGWFVESSGNYPVKAMPATYLVNDYIIPAARKYSSEQLTQIIRRFEERCRDVEF